MSGSVEERQHAVNTPEARTPTGDAFSALVVEVLRCADLLRAAGDELARPEGLTSAQWRVLAVLEHGGSTVAQIARALGLARQSVQRVADTVVVAGLAAYVDNPDDRRAQLAELSDEGRRALEAIQTRQVAWANEVAGSTQPTRFREAAAFLHEIARSLTAPAS